MASISPSFLDAPNSPHDDSVDNHIRLTITSITQDDDTNTTTVAWKLTIVRTPGTPWTTLSAARATLGNRVLYDHHTGGSIASNWSVGQQFASGVETFDNNDDGTLSLVATVKQMFYYGNGVASRWESPTITQSASTTMVCSTIPRGAIITSANNIDDTSNRTIRITYDKPAGATISTLQLALSLDGVTPLFSWNIPDPNEGWLEINLTQSDVDTLCYDTPDSPTLPIYYLLTSTIAGQSPITDIETATFTVVNNDASIPIVSSSQTKVSTLPYPFNQYYVQGRTKVGVVITASAYKGASIASYETTFEGKTYTGSSFTTDYIKGSSSLLMTISVTDTRGYKRTMAISWSFVPYASPYLAPYTGESKVICGRANADGTLSATGTYMRVKCKRVYSSVYNQNKCLVQYRVSENGGAYSAWVTAKGRLEAGDDISLTIPGIFDSLASSYTVQLKATDDVGDTFTTTLDIPIAHINLHLKQGGHGVGVGKVCEKDNYVEIGYDVEIKGSSVADFVVDQGKDSSGWSYRKWYSGAYELWRLASLTISGSTKNGNTYTSNQISVTIPANLALYSTVGEFVNVNLAAGTGSGTMWLADETHPDTKTIKLRFASGAAITPNPGFVAIEVRGRWKE